MYQCKAGTPVSTKQDPEAPPAAPPIIILPTLPPERTRTCLLVVSTSWPFLRVSASTVHPPTSVSFHLLLTLYKWDHAVQSVCHAILTLKITFMESSVVTYSCPSFVFIAVE